MSIYKNLKEKLNSYHNWFNRVFLHKKASIFTYKEKKLNNKFDQYYKFLDTLKKYNMITVNDAINSQKDVKENQIKEQKELAKSIWPEKFQDKLGKDYFKEE
jgi:hypothetical protein